MILLIFASCVARITGMSHQHPSSALILHLEGAPQKLMTIS
jgi:hypothetical protein